MTDEFAHVCRECGWRGSRRHVLRFCPSCGGLEIFGVRAVPVVNSSETPPCEGAALGRAEAPEWPIG